jgi:hypothetical protein
METKIEPNQKTDSDDKSTDVMSKHGIACIPVNYYHYGDFRYTNLDDAIAQAKRQQQLRKEESDVDQEEG